MYWMVTKMHIIMCVAYDLSPKLIWMPNVWELLPNEMRAAIKKFSRHNTGFIRDNVKQMCSALDFLKLTVAP